MTIEELLSSIAIIDIDALVYIAHVIGIPILIILILGWAQHNTHQTNEKLDD